MTAARNPWTKKEEKSEYHYKPILCYAHNQSALINEIAVYKNIWDQCCLELRIENDKYNEFLQHIKTLRLWAPRGIDRALHRYSLEIPNTEFLENLLNTLSSITPDINLIANDIVAAFKPNSPEEPSIPGWTKLREIGYEYRPHTIKNKIKCISVSPALGHDSFHITILTKKSCYQEFVKVLPHEDGILKHISAFTFDVKSIEELTALIKILSVVEPAASALIDPIIEQINKEGVKHKTPNRLMSQHQLWATKPSEPISSQAQYNIDGERIDSPRP